jgi:hypothetical protein
MPRSVSGDTLAKVMTTSLSEVYTRPCTTFKTSNQFLDPDFKQIWVAYRMSYQQVRFRTRGNRSSIPEETPFVVDQLKVLKYKRTSTAATFSAMKHKFVDVSLIG